MNFFMRANYRGGQGYSEVTDYAARVTAAGGTLADGDEARLNTFVGTLKTNSIWDKIKDMGFFLGGFNGAFVKLKAPNSSLENCVNTGFTSSHYNEAKGITSSDTVVKKISTGFVPADHGLSKTNFHICVKFVDLIDTANTWLVLDDKAAGNLDFAMKSTEIGIYTAPFPTAITPYTKVGDPTFRFLSFTSTGVIWGWDYNSKYAIPPTYTIPNVTLAGTVSLLGGRVSGSGVPSKGSISFYSIGEQLTYDEIKILEDAVDDFLISKGRITDPACCIVFGDSITKGEKVTLTTRFSYLLAEAFGLRERNMGNHSSAMIASVQTSMGGYDRRADIRKYRMNGSKVIIQYGVNDFMAQDTSPTGDSTKIATFTSNLETICSELIAAGVAAGDIQIGSPSIVTTTNAPTARQQAWVAGAFLAAQNAGVKYVDVWQYMTDNGGTATLLDADGVHPNTAGHSAIATAHQTLAAFV